jgi:hypothetical protein
MAETTPRTPRRRPRKAPVGGSPARQAPQTESNENGKSKARAHALYHVFLEDAGDGSLRLLGQYKGRNASEAIEAYSGEGNDVQGITFVVVPDRNLARVKADVETKTKVKLSAA